MNSHSEPAEIRDELNKFSQQHVLRFWPRLTEAQRGKLVADLGEIDLARCARLADQFVKVKPDVSLPRSIDAPPIYAESPGLAAAAKYREARDAGAVATAAGRVAAFTVAGGQGTRLGFDGPKGAFPISPIRDAPLFQLFAEQIAGAGRRYGFAPRWYIMTSPSNHEETVAFFDAHKCFGLRGEAVLFFPQRQMPAFLPDGRIALAAMDRIALSPDGHGGSLRALREGGALADMRSHGVEIISYFQVDNPLVRIFDPLFIGLHLIGQSEMSSKAVTKADDLERVGNFCLADGKLTVIEYSDLPEALAHARDAAGNRKFNAGSIAIHLLSRDFVERLTEPDSGVALPWHRAEKKVTTVDEDGRTVEPQSPNAIKLEQFVFDAIPLARNPIVLYTPRAEEFSPVKNAQGADSPATTRRDMVRRAARWLESAGVHVPRDAAGEPASRIEIHPGLAQDADELRERIPRNLQIAAGKDCLLPP